MKVVLSVAPLVDAMAAGKAAQRAVSKAVQSADKKAARWVDQ